MVFNKVKRVVMRGAEVLEHTVPAMFFKSDMSSWEDCYRYLNDIHKDVRSSAIRNKTPDDEANYKYDVSVIMTTYNRADLVERCVKSILSNVPKDDKYKVECIFINDGSKDNTEEILNRYKAYPHVTVINQENKGVSNARNTGIDTSEARYVLFVDDDDLLMEGAVEKLLKASEKGEYDIIEGGTMRVLRDGTERKEDVVESGEIEHPLGVLKGFSWGKLLRRNIFDRIIFPEKYWFEDSINSALIHGDHIKAYIIEEPVYKYFLTEGSITSSLNSPRNIDSIYVTMQLLKDRKELNLPFKQENYEYFLRMVNLTYQRTKKFDTKVRYCIFEINKYLRQEYYKDFKTEKSDYLKTIEDSLLENNFKKYVKACELHV
ncbi:MAG: glycosyltransferase family 2 protein [Filifactor alocis]|nr:glycosyltransferase family 2 protein [Filifactor alocis]